MRALGRLAVCLGHVLAGMATVWLLFPVWKPGRQAVAVQTWAGCMLNALGVKLQVERTGGKPAGDTPLLLVCNHRSWLDILVLHSQFRCRFVAKAEVHAWPLLGRMAAAAGTLFIERSSPRDALRVVHQMAAALQQGDTVAIFPEGTTSDGKSLLPFHANLFQAAVPTSAAVVPVALQYLEGRPPTPSHAPDFIGDENLSGSLWRTALCDALVARLSIGELLFAFDNAMPDAPRPDRRSMAKQAHAAVSALLPQDN
jgi:1-acyl-sn-glycerol-3-phosphate acyltransferase